MTACISLVARAVEGQRGAGVAGRRAGGALGADDVGVGEGGGHAVVFEAARGVHALVLQEQAARLEADVAADAVGHHQGRLAFADRDDFVLRGEGQQLVEPPHAAATEGFVAARPLLLEPAQRIGRGRAIPVVGDIDQRAALGASGVNFAHGEGGAAGRRQALLVGLIGINFGRRGHVGRRLRGKGRERGGGAAVKRSPRNDLLAVYSAPEAPATDDRAPR